MNGFQWNLVQQSFQYGLWHLLSNIFDKFSQNRDVDPWPRFLKVIQYFVYSIIPRLRLKTIRESYLYNVLGGGKVMVRAMREEHEAAGQVVLSLARKAC